MLGMDDLGLGLVLGATAFFAGFVDAVVGGGGLVQVPALFSMLPGNPPATLLGTNKLAGIWGTSAAALNYVRAVRLRWDVVLPAALMAFLLAFCGAYAVTQLPPTYLRKALPLILLGVALYTFKKKDFGSVHAPRYQGAGERWMAMLVGGGIGFYDGFFGPGTGSFLMFLFVRLFGYDFLSASAVAKVLNVACNAAALLWFGYSGHVIWAVGFAMAVCGVLGSLTGSRMAIKYGSGFVRKMFLLVVCALIMKTGYDAFLK
jgi:uncharacterized membrane protein YfcA